MIGELRLETTAHGRAMIVAVGECRWEEFPRLAGEVVRHLGMTVDERIDSPDVRMWITSIGAARFCVSWDHWTNELTIMGWAETPDERVEQLLCRAR